MKSTNILSIIFAVLGMAAANKLAKEQLCTEVCWTHHNSDLQNCKARCKKDERPTVQEAGQCRDCISGCGRYLPDKKNLVLYNECRKGCFATYFPHYVNGPGGAQLHKREHIPGMPPQVHKFLDGHSYPVEESICDLSCRAQGTDNILSLEGNMKECLGRCKNNPTVREQELQMSMDCSDKCLGAEPCLKSCIQEHASSRAPGLSFATGVPDQAAAGPSDLSAASGSVAENSIAGGAVPASAVAGSDTAAGSTAAGTASAKATASATKPSKASSTSVEEAAESNEELIPASTDAFDASADVSASQSKPTGARARANSATGMSYFEGIWFWIHAAGTIVIALFIGLQVV